MKITNAPGIGKALFGLNIEPPKYLLEILGVIYMVTFAMIWQFTFPDIIPKFEEISEEFTKLLFTGGLLYELYSSVSLLFKAIGYSVLVSLVISYGGSVFNFMKPITAVLPKFRFWSLFGFQAIIRVLASDGDMFKVILFMFGLIPFLVDSFNILFAKVKEEGYYEYARTLGLPEWEVVIRILVRSKLPAVFRVVGSNIAIAWVMLPMVEVSNRDGGGIGAMLFDKTRFITGDNGYGASFALQGVFLSCGILIDYAFKLLVYLLPEERARKISHN